MIYLILCLVAVWFLVFCALIYKSVVIKNSVTGKRSIDFSNFKKSFLSKFIWAFIGTVLIVHSITLLIPIFWMMLTSVKDVIDFELNTFGLPNVKEYGLHFENFLIVLRSFEITEGMYTYGLGDMLFNSIIYSCGNPLVQVFWIYVMAYVMARFTWFGNKFLYNLGVLIMMVTLTGTSASQMIIFQKIGLYDNLYLSIILPPSTAFSGMYFMMVYGCCRAISQTYSEAAYIDGANEYVVMFRIIFPMVLPTLTTIYVITFLSLWNQYESFLVWYPSFPNIAYGLYRFQYLNAGSGGISTPQVISGMLLVMVPSLILYILTHKIMQSNFVVGGLKG